MNKMEIARIADTSRVTKALRKIEHPDESWEEAEFPDDCDMW